MSWLDDITADAAAAQKTLGQVTDYVNQGEALYDQITGRNRGASSPSPPTAPNPLAGFSFSPLVLAGIFAAIIVGLALSVRR